MKNGGKQPETDNLVVTRSYGTRQQPPMNATGSGAIAGTENASTFAGGNEKTSPRKSAQVQPERIPDLFRDKRVEEWRASEVDGSAGRESDDGETGNGDGVDTDELNEELEDLNCAREDYSEAPGIGPEEIDLIIDLCNGKDIPAGRRLSLLKAIHHIKDTRIERSILEVSTAATAVSANFWMMPSAWARLLRTVTNQFKKEITMTKGYYDMG